MMCSRSRMWWMTRWKILDLGLPGFLDCKPYSTPDEVLDNSASGIKEEGAINSVNAAKVAAMKAAELVNRNIVAFAVGTGCLSSDQKKRMLWRNKIGNPSEINFRKQ